jgi:hypothetical protein
MRFDVTPQDDGARLRVAIDYELPSRNRWMGWLFGPTYARWCVQQMIGSTKRQFGG